jgi:hypothetical protein
MKNVTPPVRSIVDFMKRVDWTYENTYLFRGQSHLAPLLPKLARLRLPPDTDSKHPILKTEKGLLAAFGREAIPYLDPTIDKKSPWEVMAMAQHHGLPTRLLDWTENPLVALWFAVCGEPLAGENGVVWQFKTSPESYVKATDNPFSSEYTMIFRPSHITPRIVVQGGWFTCHRYMPRKKTFIPFELNKHYMHRLKKIEIAPRCYPRLRLELDRCGFNYAHLFPDLEGLCRKIAWTYCHGDAVALTRRSRKVR